MSVEYSGGIGFGKKSGAMFMDLSVKGKKTAKPNTQSTADEDPTNQSASVPWSKWGSNNLKPQEYVDDIKKCSVLISGIEGKARFGLGLGVKPVNSLGYNKDKGEEYEFINDAEINEFLDASNHFFQSFAMFRDFIGLAKIDCRIIMNRGGNNKIAAFQREDPCHIRLGKYNTQGEITRAFLSRQWNRVSSWDKTNKKVIEFPLLPQVDPAGFLLEKIAAGKAAPEYLFTTNYPLWNDRYYPTPLWTAAYDWVKIAQGVPKMKAAMFENNIRIKYMVIIHEDYWTRNYKGWNDKSQFTDKDKEAKRKKLYDDIEGFLVGSENAYKSVFVDGYVDAKTRVKVQDIEIKPIEDTTKNGELLPDSAAANSEILFALMMNPALMGADMPGGPYSGGAGSGSNIREAALVQVMIQEFERTQISRILNIVAKVNGWKDTYPNLEWRFPGLVLTTKDTGTNSKPVV